MFLTPELVHYIADGARQWECEAAVVVYSDDTTGERVRIFESGQVVQGARYDEERGSNTIHLPHMRGENPLDTPPAEPEPEPEPPAEEQPPPAEEPPAEPPAQPEPPAEQ